MIAKQEPRTFLGHDWFAGGIPANVRIEPDAYLDTSYGFDPFLSELDVGLTLGEASGAYDRTTFVVGGRGNVTVGAYTVLNGTYLFCDESITIGSHCLIAWGSVITDVYVHTPTSVTARRAMLASASLSPHRRLEYPGTPSPVTLEDNVWIGFDAVVLPGVRLGRGSIVGSKTVVAEDVPPYAVIAGQPPRIIRYLEREDNDTTRQHALNEYTRSRPVIGTDR